jgi:hypothetical protein
MTTVNLFVYHSLRERYHGKSVERNRPPLASLSWWSAKIVV